MVEGGWWKVEGERWRVEGKRKKVRRLGGRKAGKLQGEEVGRLGGREAGKLWSNPTSIPSALITEVTDLHI